MFKYNARTEVHNGAKFIEKDIILFDYDYTEDILVRADVNLVTSGFGFVITEHLPQDSPDAANTYLIRIHSDNTYDIIHKYGSQQSTLDQGYFLSSTRVYGDDTDPTLFFRIQDQKLILNKAVLQEDGRFHEISLVEYLLAAPMETYQVGIYSNGGNTVKYITISTEAPSNWITNVFNANGGRIRWIRDGFTIDEAEYDIEAEAERIELKAGTYYFSYETDNPDIKAYIYESYPDHLKPTNTRRSRDEILGVNTDVNTMIDEEKNILDENNSFTLTKNHAVNIKFKGKWGTVKNICISINKNAEFVETTYDSIYRSPGRLLFDLNKIKKIKLRTLIRNIPEQDLSRPLTYHLFQRGMQAVGLSSLSQLGTEITYDFDAATGNLSIKDEIIATLTEEDNILSAFYNVTADIRELIVITNTGEEINVLLQNTIIRTISGEITSPILVTFPNGDPLELSSSYRKAISVQEYTEAFHAYNPIKLKYDPVLSNPNIVLYGVSNHVSLYRNDGSFTNEKVKISYTPTRQELMHKTIALPSSIKQQYKWIIVEYNAIIATKYIFTPWEREIYNLTKDARIYLSKQWLPDVGNILIRGIKDEKFINKPLLYHIPQETLVTSIDLCCDQYDNIVDKTKYRVTDNLRIVLDADVQKEYQYLIIDYLKADAYAINYKNNNWEIEISSSSNANIISYDSEDGMTTIPFKILSAPEILNKRKEGDFIVLEEEL